MKKELTPSEVLFDASFDEKNNKVELKDMPQVKAFYKNLKKSITIDKKGYNLYLIDSFSNEKLNEIVKFVEGIYKDLKAPQDICYVTFMNNKKPEALFLGNGRGNTLKKYVDDIKESYFNVAMEFYRSSSESDKDLIIEEVHQKRSEYIEELVELSKEHGFDVKATSGGFAFLPLKEEGKAMSEKEYDQLSEDNKESIISKAAYLKKQAEGVLDKLRDMELDAVKELKKLYEEFLSSEMEFNKDDCLLEFITEDDVYEYLERVFIEIEKGIVDCYSINMDEDEQEIVEVISNFQISVLVDNTNYSHPRVIYEEDPNPSNLIGAIEYENHNGNYVADISLITPGSLILANGGCLIIRLNQLANNVYSYYNLKKVLLTGKVNIEGAKSYLDVLSINGLKPESIKTNVKVILIGDYMNYDYLYNEDEDFRKLFELRAEYPSIVDKSYINREAIENLINYLMMKNNIKKISNDAVNEIIKYLSRIAQDKTRISIDSSDINKILILAKNQMYENNKDEIGEKEVIDVVYTKEKVQVEMLSSYKDNKMIITLSGRKIGVINGLSVLDTGWCSFGKPMRITCVICKGDGRIIDIQKESNLSGSIHEKSINILKGVISNLINPYEKLPVDFYLSFEQSYGIIDGDSASVAELLCMLSCLGKKGIRQDIAVTGSINQLGEIQPIGGLNEKIEGIYNVWKLKGENDELGVLIPSSNKDELILNYEVEKAIKNKKLHIYTMDTLGDAIETMILDGEETLDNFYSEMKKEILKYK